MRRLAHIRFAAAAFSAAVAVGLAGCSTGAAVGGAIGAGVGAAGSVVVGTGELAVDAADGVLGGDDEEE